MRERAAVDTVLVWHLDLLRLVPFIAGSRRQLIVFLHGIEAWRRQDPVTNALLRRTDLFLSNSDFTWKRFLEFHSAGARRTQRTVHLGLGEPLECQAPPHGTPTVLMVGRMRKSEDYKGHREMIRIWPRVLEREECAELRIVGDGDLRPELERLAEELGVASRVRFFGAVSDECKAELLQQSRALVLPSAAEGFGLVYLEAMRMGRPCIVSTVDAGREVVNPPEAGFAVDLNDSDRTLHCLLKVLTPGAEWAAMADRARRRYESQFTASHFRRRLNEALQA